MNLFYRIYFCVLFFSLNAVASETFDLGTLGMPLSIPAEMRTSVPRTDELKLKDDFQTGSNDGRLLFSLIKGNDTKIRAAFSSRWNKDREKDVNFGALERAAVANFFRRIHAEGETVYVDLGNGLWALATYRTLVADYSQENNPKVFATFFLSSVDPKPEGDEYVFEPQTGTLELPLETAASRIFPLKPSLLDASIPAYEQMFFLEATGEIPFPVILLGYGGIDPAAGVPNIGDAYVVSKKDLLARKEFPKIFKIPVSFLRFANSSTVRDINLRFTNGYPSQWLWTKPMDPGPALGYHLTFEQRVSALQTLFQTTLGTSLTFSRSLKSLSCETAVISE
jgi:hypothetical protein